MQRAGCGTRWRRGPRRRSRLGTCQEGGGGSRERGSARQHALGARTPRPPAPRHRAPLQSSGRDSARHTWRGRAAAAAARALAVADPQVDHVGEVLATHAAVGRDGVLGGSVVLVHGVHRGAAAHGDARAPHGGRRGRHAALARRREARVAVRDDGGDAARAVALAPRADAAPEALAAHERRALAREVLRGGGGVSGGATSPSRAERRHTARVRRARARGDGRRGTSEAHAPGASSATARGWPTGPRGATRGRAGTRRSGPRGPCARSRSRARRAPRRPGGGGGVSGRRGGANGAPPRTSRFQSVRFRMADA